ncbi:hypothetical protein Bbelb_441170 [Branchiostoma belcheri]|nr:hypothetical protein Bbelb_441170 [Branchiostoma belcheri]
MELSQLKTALSATEHTSVIGYQANAVRSGQTSPKRALVEPASSPLFSKVFCLDPERAFSADAWKVTTKPEETLQDEVGLNDRDLPAAMLDRNQKCSCRPFIVLLYESGSVRAPADPVIVLRITPRTLGELRTTPDRTLGVTT